MLTLPLCSVVFPGASVGALEAGVCAAADVFGMAVREGVSRQRAFPIARLAAVEAVFAVDGLALRETPSSFVLSVSYVATS